ncbi:hypothetical protein GGH96_001682 [Coemansia sp. RSA 1972]|nr:hypothetical protein GGH96_001682 [Coemansia sp. RSA 1972]
MYLSTLLVMLASMAVYALPIESDDGTESRSVGPDMMDTGTAISAPQSTSKCTVGCGIGIGVGCLAGLVLIAFLFVMARRHKRKIHTLWHHRRWMATHKALPDKPMPAPPLPTKS